MSVLNIAMAFLMFSVALDVQLHDFKQVLLFPKAIIGGVLVQYLFFPLLTLSLIFIAHPPVSIALGMILVSGCPSGNMTNFLVHHAKGNVPLSVTLNTIIILSATLLTPASFLFWSAYVPEADELRKSFVLPFGQMALIIVQLILIPLVIGVTLRRYFPDVVSRYRNNVQKLALFIFFAILIGAFVNNIGNVKAYLPFVFVLVTVHNILGMAAGYYFAKLIRLTEKDARTFAFESGVHNTALGLILIFNFFNGLGGMALIAAWWGIWDLVTGFALAEWWRRHPVDA
jgi:BASS family bile acid:Na+ symporter